MLCAGLVLVGFAAAGLLGAPGAGATPRSHRSGGPVDVLYAGSLVTQMEDAIGPAFDGATGYTFSGFAGGSDALASEIKGRTQLADVFISASPGVNAELEGPKNGSWVSWFARFGSSPLVIGYNPSSSFASQLRSRPWYEVVSEPGFLLGRTDPAIDPKGKLTDEVLMQAAAAHNLPALAAIARSTTGVYPEEALVGRLQSGQLDAGFFYKTEAAAANIPTVSLAPLTLDAEYTVTVLNRAPHRQAALAFVKFLLGRQGRAILERDGVSMAPRPVVSESVHVPVTLRAILHVG